MSVRGRRWVEYVSDDDDGSVYEELNYPPPPPRRDRSRLRVDVREERLRSPARRQKVYAAPPMSAVEPENIIIENHLNVPQVARPRASSTGARPQPNVIQPIFVQPPSREPSRERHKHYHSHYEYSESSDDSGHRSSSRRRHRSRRPKPIDNGLDPELAVKIAKMELLQEEQRQKQKYVDPETAAELARLKYLERSRERDEREASVVAKYKERQRQEEEAEKAAIAAAEAKRLAREAEMKAENERVMLLQREKAAQEKAERQRIIAEEKARVDRERKEVEEERKRILYEERAKADREKREAEEERKRILYEEELRKKKQMQEHEELRKQILAEEEARVTKEKAKKKKEEEEFQQKVKERFMKAGYSPEYIEDILEERKKSVARKTSVRNSENSLALDISRPTYIRVRLEHLYPETLDYYQLPWDYDPEDDRYILIKEYISHEFQQELFEHTKKLKLKVKRETRMITDGYVKDTVTTLKPRNVFKDKNSDEMYLVRRKSESRSPMRRSWMFT